MGATASILGMKEAEAMSVDLVPNRKLKVFPRQIFRKYEWVTLKAFCQKYNVQQIDLIRVFTAFLSHDEVYFREFRVRTVDTKNKFKGQSQLMQVPRTSQYQHLWFDVAPYCPPFFK
jgi:hypothetical protein